MSYFELVALVVRDYDAAIRFFVKVLEFELVEDTPSRGNRWDLLGRDPWADSGGEYLPYLFWLF